MSSCAGCTVILDQPAEFALKMALVRYCPVIRYIECSALKPGKLMICSPQARFCIETGFELSPSDFHRSQYGDNFVTRNVNSSVISTTNREKPHMVASTTTGRPISRSEIGTTC